MTTTTPKTQRRRSPVSTQGERMSNWEALSTTAKPHLADNPPAAADHAAFEALISQIKTANLEQESLTAKLRDSICGRKAMTAQGRKLRNHLVSHLQSKFGPDSDMLREFGIRPKIRPRRKPAPAAAGEPSASPAGSSVLPKP